MPYKFESKNKFVESNKSNEEGVANNLRSTRTDITVFTGFARSASTAWFASGAQASRAIEALKRWLARVEAKPEAVKECLTTPPAPEAAP